MRIASLSSSLSLQPFKAKLVDFKDDKFLQWGIGENKPKTILHRFIPPTLKADYYNDLFELENAHAYFYNRNRVILAKDKRNDYKNLLLYVNLRVHRSFSGKVIKVEEYTDRLFYDHSSVDEDRNFIHVASLVYIKKGEIAELIDYVDDEQTTIIVDNSKDNVMISRSYNED